MKRARYSEYSCRLVLDMWPQIAEIAEAAVEHKSLLAAEVTDPSCLLGALSL